MSSSSGASTEVHTSRPGPWLLVCAQCCSDISIYLWPLQHQLHSLGFLCTMIFVVSSPISRPCWVLRVPAIITFLDLHCFLRLLFRKQGPALLDLLAPILSFLPPRAQHLVLQNATPLFSTSSVQDRRKNYTPGGQPGICLRAGSLCFCDTRSPGTIIAHVMFSSATWVLKPMQLFVSLRRVT